MRWISYWVAFISRHDCDAAICKLITQDYDRRLGSRSLVSAVETHVIGPLLTVFLDMEEETWGNEELDDYLLDMRDGELIVTRIIPCS